MEPDVRMSRIEALTVSFVPVSPSVSEQVDYSVISWLTRCYCPLQQSVATSLNPSTFPLNELAAAYNKHSTALLH